MQDRPYRPRHPRRVKKPPREHVTTRDKSGWGGLAFSPDGKTLAAFPGGNQVYLYKITYTSGSPAR
jgi:hypothetical protein